MDGIKFMVHVKQVGKGPLFGGDSYWIDVADLLAAAGVTVTGTPLSELSAENAELLGQIDELQTEKRELEAKLDNNAITLHGLNAQVAELTQGIENREAEIANLRLTLRNAIFQRDAARAIIRDVNMRTGQVRP